MLKISIIEAGNERRLVLDGSLIGPWTDELKSAYDRARTELDGRKLVLSLDDVTAISEEGEAVLIALMNEGIKVRCRGVFTKMLVRQLAHRARNENRGTRR
jgi:hypothetical protein